LSLLRLKVWDRRWPTLAMLPTTSESSAMALAPSLAGWTLSVYDEWLPPR